MKTYILYHANCPDGFGAAYAFHQKYGDEATYLPQEYGYADAPDMEKNAQIFILDFSYKREMLNALKDKHSNIVLIDHHISAKDDLKGLDFAHFDMSKSGAVLAWEYLYDTPVPALFNYLQDKDLWTWKLPHSKEINSFISTVDYNFSDWDNVINNFEKNPKPFIEIGKSLLKSDCLKVKEIIEHARMISFAGHNVPCVNSPILNSEIGHELIKRHPESNFSVSWFLNKHNEIKISLRSEGFDVSKVAEKFGGGGHTCAAGCTVSDIPR
jgi:oligoribonuclease NrnB/cAMP/cGMP phosphodiesterase (DHH superfamily)